MNAGKGWSWPQKNGQCTITSPPGPLLGFDDDEQGCFLKQRFLRGPVLVVLDGMQAVLLPGYCLYLLGARHNLSGCTSCSDLLPSSDLYTRRHALQSTYAKLVTEDDGSIGIRVLEQKIWVRGESYELQEIYGMDQTMGPSAQSSSQRLTDGLEDIIEGNECIICM